MLRKVFMSLCLIYMAHFLYAQDLVTGEYFWDTDPGIGNATAISFQATSSLDESFSINVPSPLTKGKHILYVRMKDADGTWGPARQKTYVGVGGLDLVKGEYYWNTDPGYGMGSPLTFAPNDTVNQPFSVNVPANLPQGPNRLYTRFKDAGGAWGQSKAKVYVNTVRPEIVSAEYFWNTDPGFGQATPLPIPSPGSQVSESYILDASALPVGKHTLVVRVRDEEGAWSTTSSETILISQPIYVDQSATGANSGTSWADAFTSLNQALNTTTEAIPALIRVAEGIYTADEGTGHRDSTFVLLSNTTILGGYPAGGDVDDNRDPKLYETILSGDIGTQGDSTDNAYHVITTVGAIDVTADGLIIERGQANGGGEHDNGAGWHNDGKANPAGLTIEQCVFRNNYAYDWGAGMYNNARTPTGDITVNYRKCTFQNNNARVHAGAVLTYSDTNGGQSEIDFYNCFFLSNTAETDHAGAVFNNGHFSSCQAQYTNCVFRGNYGDRGGAMSNWGNADVNINNCSFANNESPEGEHIYANASTGSCEVNITNTLFDDTNSDGDVFHILSGAVVDVAYSLIDGPLSAGANDLGGNLINTAPQYLDVNMGNLRLNVNSPAVDGGNNSVVSATEDIEGNVRIQNTVVDMGAYENPSDDCLLTYNAISSCSGGITLLSGDTIFTTFTVPNGIGPYNVTINGTTYTDLMSEDTVVFLVEGEDFQGNAPYTFDVSFEATEDVGGGCISNTDTVVVTFDVIPQALLTVDDADGNFCVGQTVSYSVSPSNLGSYSFFDDLNDNDVMDGGEELQQGASNIYSPTYTVAGATPNVKCLTGSGSCFSVSSSVASTVQPLPAAAIAYTEDSGLQSDDGELCHGDTLFLTASGGGSYLWSTAQTTASISAAVSSGDSYSLTVTDAFGCMGVASMTPVVDDALVLILDSLNNISCFGQTDGVIGVSASGGVAAYSFDIGNGSQASGVFEDLAPAKYTVVLSDAHTCEALDSFDVLEPGLLVASASVTDELCYDDSTGVISINVNGGTPPFTYDIGGGPQSASTFTGMTAGSYTIDVIDASGCQTQTMAMVQAPDSLSIIVLNQQNATCSNGALDGEIEFEVMGGVEPYSYSIGQGSQADGYFADLAAGPYTFTITDANGCTLSQDFEIGSESLSAFLEYSFEAPFEGDIVFPLAGSQYETFRFEVDYIDPNDQAPVNGYPRLYLDYESNGIYTNSKDRIYVMSEVDANDTDMTDGKRFYVDVDALAVGSDWAAYVIALDANGCQATLGPTEGPDVLANSNVYIYSNDIRFSTNNPNRGEFFNVISTIHNNSSFDAENFKVALYNEYSEVYEDTMDVALLAAGGSRTLNWSVRAPNEDVFVPYRVVLDIEEDVDESNELDNDAAKPVIVGDFTLPVQIVMSQPAQLSPSSATAGTIRALSASFEYDGLPDPSQDNKVKGAEVMVTIQQTGQVFTGYTDNNGELHLSILAPIDIGTYTLVGSISDGVLSTNLSFPSLTVAPHPPGCVLPDLVVTATADRAVLNTGDTLTGTFTVSNVGCGPSDSIVTLDLSFPGANGSFGPFQIENLLPDEDTTFHWQVTYADEGRAIITAEVDQALKIEEIEKTNNRRSIRVTVANNANLVTPTCHQIAITPNLAGPGDLVTIAFPIRNFSLVDVEEDFQVSLSAGPEESIFVVDQDIPSYTSLTVSGTLLLPPDSTDMLRIQIDYADEVGEFNEVDNSRFYKLCKNLSIKEPYPAEKTISFWERQQVVNQSVDMQIAIFSDGLLTPNDVLVQYEVMGPGYPDWTVIGTTIANLSAVTCGQGLRVSPDLPFAFTQIGTYDVRMTIDPNNAIYECDLTDNVIEVQVQVADIPDLTTSSLFINPSDLNPNVNEDIFVNLSYKNVAQANLLDTFDLSVLVDGQLLEVQRVPGLPNGSVATVAFASPWSSNVTGPHVIQAVVDGNMEVAELNETNNEASRSILVGGAPNLHFASFQSSDTMPGYGDQVLLQAVIGNEGDLDCSANLEVYYLDSNGDTILIDSTPITVQSQDSAFYVFTYEVDRPEVLIFAQISAGAPTEYNLLDNESSFTLTAGTPPCNLIVSNVLDSGEGSLRQCITCANESDNYKVISFNIPGSGDHTINLASSLPSISGDSTVIDASTQTGNFPMAGKVTIDVTGVLDYNRVGVRVSADNVEIYGTRWINTNLTGNSTAIYYSLGSDSLVLGDSLKGNWFVEDKWASAVYLKENLNKGVIQCNVFRSDSLRLQTALIINSGTNRIQVGGDSLWQQNQFIGCTSSAIELRNHSNNNRILNNYFEKNEIAIRNRADLFAPTGVNSGNQYLGNRFVCNTIPIQHAQLSNQGLPPATIAYSKLNFVYGDADPGNVVELYYTPDTCMLGVDCQGDLSLGRDTVGADGKFHFTFMEGDYLEQGKSVTVIQTDTLFKGSSVFSECSTIDSSCVDFVFTCEDEIVGSLRSAIDCAAPGDTVYFLSYLTGEEVLLTDSLVIDKDISIEGLGNPGLSVASMSDGYLVKVNPGKEVYIRELILCVTDTGASGIVNNYGDLNLQNITIVDKRNNQTLDHIYNQLGSSLTIKDLVEILKQ